MDRILYNFKQIENIFEDAKRLFNENGKLRFSYEKFKSDKSKEQLGYFFGALVSSIVDFFENENGEKMSKDDVKEILYNSVSPIVNYIDFNGVYQHRRKRIHEMNVEEMADLIDKTIYTIDFSPMFEKLILSPEIRHCWIKRIDKNDIRNIDFNKWNKLYPEYLEYQRKQACIRCGVYPSEPHHLKEKNFSGVSEKSPDWMTIPLCRNCHNDLHNQGQETFYKDLKYITNNLTMLEFCILCFNRWYNRMYK